MTYSKIVLTKSGKELMTNLLNSEIENIEFSKCVMSTKEYVDGELETLTELDEIVSDAPISRKEIIDSETIKITCRFTNESLNNDYLIKSYGVYVKVDDIDILYGIAKENSGCGYVSRYNGESVSEIIVATSVKVGNSKNAIVRVDPSAMASMQYVDEKIENDAEVKIVFSDNTETRLKKIYVVPTANAANIVLEEGESLETY